jgi:hypothetical protein
MDLGRDGRIEQLELPWLPEPAQSQGSENKVVPINLEDSGLYLCS